MKIVPIDSISRQKLKEYLLRQLQRVGSSSDSDVLADYILALLEKELDIDEHEKYVSGELETFIEDSKEFTSALFRAILDNSYQEIVPESEIEERSERSDDDDDDGNRWRNRNRDAYNEDDNDNDGPDTSNSYEDIIIPSTESDATHEEENRKQISNPLSKQLSSRYEPDPRDQQGRKRRNYADNSRMNHQQDRHRRRYDDRDNRNRTSDHRKDIPGYSNRDMYNRMKNYDQDNRRHHYDGPTQAQGPYPPAFWNGAPAPVPDFPPMPMPMEPNYFPPMPDQSNYPRANMYRHPNTIPHGGTFPEAAWGSFNSFLQPQPHMQRPLRPPPPLSQQSNLSVNYGGPLHPSDIRNFGPLGPSPPYNNRQARDGPDGGFYPLPFHSNADVTQVYPPGAPSEVSRSAIDSITMGYKSQEVIPTPENVVTEPSNNEAPVSKLNPKAVEYVPTSSDVEETVGKIRNFQQSNRGSFKLSRGMGRAHASSRVWHREQSNMTASDDMTAKNSSIQEEIQSTDLVTASETREDIVKPVVNEVKITMENVIVQQKYEDLRKLRSVADDIWKKKELLIQTQIDNIRDMIGKLDNLPSSATLTGELESKLIKLQAQLSELKEQRDKGIVSNNLQQESIANFIAGRGSFNRGGRNISRGRFAATRGRGAFRGGRGRFSWVATDDNKNDAKLDESEQAATVSEDPDNASRHLTDDTKEDISIAV